jgi:DNA-binding response OmpR family regulator
MVQPMVILVVEDQAIIGLALALELQDAGHTVIGPVGSIELAEYLVEQSHPDLALVDIDLQHVGDGIELARSLQLDAHVKTVFVTGRPAAARAHADLALGVIKKPFSCSDIPRSIDAVQALMAGVSPPPPDIPPQLELFETLH